MHDGTRDGQGVCSRCRSWRRLGRRHFPWGTRVGKHHDSARWRRLVIVIVERRRVEFIGLADVPLSGSLRSIAHRALERLTRNRFSKSVLRGFCSNELRRANDVALVGSILNLSENAAPILLVRVVTLDDLLEFETGGRRRQPFAAQLPDHAVDSLAQHGWGLFFEPHEVLLIEGLQALDVALKVIQRGLQ